MNNRTILVPVDGSKQSLETVRYVSKTFAGTGTEVTLFHVKGPIPESFWSYRYDMGFKHKAGCIDEWEFQKKNLTDKFLEQACYILKVADFSGEGINVSITARKRKVTEEIASETLKGYDGVVLGRRGKSKQKGQIMGRVTSRLANTLHNHALWVVDGCPDSNKVLIAMDGSACSMRACDYIGNMLCQTDATFLLFHSAGFEAEGLIDANGQNSLWNPTAGIGKDREREMQSVFDECKKRFEQIGVKNSKIMEKIDMNKKNPAEAIIKMAEQEGCGTIVVGRKGCSKNQKYNPGRTCNEILQLGKGLSIIIVC